MVKLNVLVLLLYRSRRLEDSLRWKLAEITRGLPVAALQIPVKHIVDVDELENNINYVQAIYVMFKGTIRAESDRCTHCQDQTGPFNHCVYISSEFHNAWANCLVGEVLCGYRKRVASIGLGRERELMTIQSRYPSAEWSCRHPLACPASHRFPSIGNNLSPPPLESRRPEPHSAGRLNLSGGRHKRLGRACRSVAPSRHRARAGPEGPDGGITEFKMVGSPGYSTRKA
jgi:hypothetical protein